MASRKDSELEEYIHSYNAELKEEEFRVKHNLNLTEGDRIDENCEISRLNSLTLRSGNTYLPLVPPRQNTNKSVTMPGSGSSSPVPTNQTLLKVLPTESSVRRFTGEEDGYAARTYLKACEDVMRQAGTTSSADKIAFTRARVEPGSQAERLLQSIALSPEAVNND